MNTDFYEVARKNMIESQLRPNQLTDDRVIDAIGRIPREIYVPEEMRSVAYIDKSICIAPDRYLMEPVTFARMAQAAGLTRDDLVLDIACTTGYSTAVLSFLAKTVVGIEKESALVQEAQDNLIHARIANADVICAAHAEGYSAQGPYNVIFVQGAVDSVPPAILNQLEEGGRLLAIIRTGLTGHLHRFTRIKNRFSDEILCASSVPFLPGFEQSEAFIF